jgi:hypothetical protein
VCNLFEPALVLDYNNKVNYSTFGFDNFFLDGISKNDYAN